MTSIKADPVEVHCYERFEVPVTVLPSNATTKGFTFKIDDPEIISFEGVSGMTGSFIAKKEGDTRVTIVSRDDASGKKSECLDMNIDLYADNDADTKQVKLLYERINRLGVFDRAIVLLWLEGLPYDEIGDIVGISAKNVSVKLVRIRAFVLI